MKQKTLWFSWLYLYILCAVLGFIPEPYGLVKALMVLLSVACFLPGFLLAYRGEAKRVRRICLLWLIAATVLVMCNFASALMPRVWGHIFYFALVILASPMVCGQYWAVSLFLGACVLMYALSLEKKEK